MIEKIFSNSGRKFKITILSADFDHNKAMNDFSQDMTDIFWQKIYINFESVNLNFYNEKIFKNNSIIMEFDKTGYYVGDGKYIELSPLKLIGIKVTFLGNMKKVNILSNLRAKIHFR